MPWNERTKRRLKLRDLDILVAVLETGSMGKAANRLGISQPAVSKGVVELEHALGVKLMDRSRRGVVPTPYGLALAKRSVAIFNDLRQGVQDIDFLTDPTKGEIRVGTTDPAMVAIVSPVIDRLSRKYPGMFFHVVVGGNETLYRDLTERNIELATCRITSDPPDELAAEILFHDSFAVMTSAKNPLTRRRNLTLGELANEPWTIFPYDEFFGGMVAEAFRAGGHEPPHVTVSSQSFSVQNELLATGRFLTVLPGFMLRVSDRRPPLKALRVKLPNTPRPIAIITLKNRTLTPLAQLFIANVRALAKSLAHS